MLCKIWEDTYVLFGKQWQWACWIHHFQLVTIHRQMVRQTTQSLKLPGDNISQHPHARRWWWWGNILSVNNRVSKPKKLKSGYQVPTKYLPNQTDQISTTSWVGVICDQCQRFLQSWFGTRKINALRKPKLPQTAAAKLPPLAPGTWPSWYSFIPGLRNGLAIGIRLTKSSHGKGET